MIFAIVLAVTTIACFALRNPIHRFPGLFYGLAVGADVLLLVVGFVDVSYGLWKAFFVLVQKCLIPFALFVVVMYIGCFARTSKVSEWLRPIRSELSVIACILTLGHAVAYIGVYVPRIFEGTTKPSVLAAFIIALALLVLLLVLGVTSFNFVKKAMKTESWLKLQKLAYLFFGLVYLHVLFMLLPSALGGGATAQVSIAIYSAVFLGYAIARIVRAVQDKKTMKPTLSTSLAEQGELRQTD